MNKLTLLFLSTCMLVFTLTSCGDDKEENGGDVSKSSYSKLNPEQQKEKLQKDAMDFLSQLDGLSEEPAYQTLNVFSSLLETSSVSLRSVNLRDSYEIIYVNDFNGKYTWNAQKKEWTESENQGSLIFEFPSSVNGQSNTEKIVITGVASNFMANKTWEEYQLCTYDEQTGTYDCPEPIVHLKEYQLPKSLTAILTSGSTKRASIEVTSDLKDNDTAPTTGSVAFVLGNYSLTFSANAANKSNNAGTATLKKGEVVLLSLSSALAGSLQDFMEENENASLGTGNFNLTIMNKLVFSGNINSFDEYSKKSEMLEEEYEIWNYYTYGLNDSSEKYEKAQSALFNQYAKITLKATDGAEIATLSMKAVKDYSATYRFGYYDNYENKWYDFVLNKYVSQEPFYTYNYWTSVPILGFKDGSSAEASVYFSKGFDDLIKQYNAFIAKFN